MARTYDGPSLKQGKVQKPVKEAESKAKDTAGDPPSTADADSVAKKTDSGPSKAGAEANPAMFGEMAPKHLSERKSMQARHGDDMASMHEKHHSEHRDMMKREGMDAEKGAEARLMMHSRHSLERSTMMGHHSMEHADMSHRHAAEMRGNGGAEAPNKEESSAKGEVDADKSPKLGKAEEKGKGGAEGK